MKPGSDWFAFDVKPKVELRGRVIDQSTGKPIDKGDVGGEVASTGADGPFAEFGKKWTHAGWAEIDKDGRFEIKVAAGRVRLAESVEKFSTSIRLSTSSSTWPPTARRCVPTCWCGR